MHRWGIYYEVEVHLTEHEASEHLENALPRNCKDLWNCSPSFFPVLFRASALLFLQVALFSFSRPCGDRYEACSPLTPQSETDSVPIPWRAERSLMQKKRGAFTVKGDPKRQPLLLPQMETWHK